MFEAIGTFSFYCFIDLCFALGLFRVNDVGDANVQHR